MLLLVNNVQEKHRRKSRQRKFWKRAHAISNLHSCYNFARVLHKNAVVLSQSEACNFKKNFFLCTSLHAKYVTLLAWGVRSGTKLVSFVSVVESYFVGLISKPPSSCRRKNFLSRVVSSAIFVSCLMSFLGSLHVSWHRNVIRVVERNSCGSSITGDQR